MICRKATITTRKHAYINFSAGRTRLTDFINKIPKTEPVVTAYTLFIGTIGAAIAYYLSFPVFLLTGPALLVSIASITGLPLAISTKLRDVAFLFIGISIGSGVNAEAADAFLRWPLAFLVLAIVLIIALWASQEVLHRVFKFDRRTSILAATPGHLSFVLGLGASLNADTTKIAVTQSVRLLALTISVPFIALLLGIDFNVGILPAGEPMPIIQIGILVLISVPFGLLLKYFKVPAGLLIGAMIISAASHLSEATIGPLTPYISLPCFLVMGTLIGSRFSGVTLQQLRQFMFAGLLTTALTVSIAVIAAVPLASFLGMPVAHVLVAFAPGGLETMIAMGAVLGANPGFVAACHVGRLLVLTILVPAFLAKFGQKTSRS